MQTPVQGSFAVWFLIWCSPQTWKQMLLSTSCQLQEEFSNKGFAHSWAGFFPSCFCCEFANSLSLHISSVLPHFTLGECISSCWSLLLEYAVLSRVDLDILPRCLYRCASGGSLWQAYSSRDAPAGVSRAEAGECRLITGHWRCHFSFPWLVALLLLENWFTCSFPLGLYKRRL